MEEEKVKRWYVVRIGAIHYSTVADVLESLGVEYFVPVRSVEKRENGLVFNKEVVAFKGIVFVRTEENILELISRVNVLRSPLYDPMTNRPAVVDDVEFNSFRALLIRRPEDVKVLNDPYSKFSSNLHVRVKFGPFTGLHGYLVRVNRDRKLVISLGDRAIAISGLQFGLFELYPEL